MMGKGNGKETARQTVSSSFTSSSAHIQLGPDLWFDSVTATITRQGKQILLTAREAALLRILLKPPYPWHTSSDLARKLSKRLAVVTEAHSIEQIVYGLRRKLGENGIHPHVLLSRYGHGYRIVVQEADSSHQEEE